MPKFTSAVALALVVVAAFCAGVTVAGPATLSAQDRGPQRPTPTPPDKAKPTNPAPMVWGEGSGAASATNGMIAVTGSYGVGTSVLYVIDTNTKQLAVYEARGGSPDAAKLFLVGARRIDLDLQLRGYNDLSEHSYEQLERKFDGRDKLVRDSATDHPIPVEGRR
jgi:hypothetical protein